MTQIIQLLFYSKVFVIYLSVYSYLYLETACVDDGPFGGKSDGGGPFSDRNMIKHGNITGLYITINDKWVNW